MSFDPHDTFNQSHDPGALPHCVIRNCCAKTLIANA